MNLPAVVKVWFSDGVESKVKPLHSTTVLLSPDLAVKLKVEVMSVTLFMSGRPSLVRVV